MTIATKAITRTSPVRTIKALIDGRWYGDLEQTDDVRRVLQYGDEFRGWVSADGNTRFRAEPHRYHLYVSYACPWAHRTVIYRQLKGLEDVVSMSVLHPRWADSRGWKFEDGAMSTIDHIGHHRNLYQVYQAAKANFTGRVTVPVLWDRKTKTIVNNQSGDIIRMFNSEFDAWGDASVDFYPPELMEDIDRLNEWLLPNVCGAVYRAGFASSQAAYDDAINTLFASLDELEQRLQVQPYLHGNRITESDWHLFATLCRFDAVYYGALRCNLRRLSDYPALTAFTAGLQEQTGIGNTVRYDQMKHHYYDAIDQIDATIVPLGPEVEYLKPVRSGADVTTDFAASSAQESVFVAEIVDLHRYLSAWLKGEIISDPRGPMRLQRALADDFKMIQPNGTRQGKEDVMRNFMSAYGDKPADYSLDVEVTDFELLPGGFGFAIYNEFHSGEAGRARRCSALLRQRASQNDVEWLYLQETYTTD